MVLFFEKNNMVSFLDKFKNFSNYSDMDKLKLNNLKQSKKFTLFNHYKSLVQLYNKKTNDNSIFIISILVLLSTIGYGFFLIKLLKFEKFDYNYGLVGILGLFTLSVIASYTHLFFLIIIFTTY